MKKLIIIFLQWIKNFSREKLRLRHEELPYYIIIFIAAILFTVGLNAFIELTDELAENELDFFDEAVTGFVLSFRQEALTGFFQFMTHMGDRVAYGVITLIIGAYFFIKHRSWRFILEILAVMTLSTLSNIMIKRVVNRARPPHEHLAFVDTLSYPSGHSMSAMAFYGFLIYLVFQLKLSRFFKILLISVLVLLILTVGLSRIYLGVHYPSDVAAGFMGGLIWVTFCIIIFNVIELLRRRKGNVDGINAK